MPDNWDGEPLVYFDAAILIFTEVVENLKAVGEQGRFSLVIKLQIFPALQHWYLIVSTGCNSIKDTKDPIASFDASKSTI